MPAAHSPATATICAASANWRKSWDWKAHDTEAAAPHLDWLKSRRAGLRGGAGAEFAARVDRVFQFAYRTRREKVRGRHARPPRRHGENRQPAARRQSAAPF